MQNFFDVVAIFLVKIGENLRLSSFLRAFRQLWRGRSLYLQFAV